MRKLALTALTALLCLIPLPALAEEPLIEGAHARPAADGWIFAVTLRHPDTGWDHYADGWEVLDAGGRRLGFRKLLHPHVDEQPFTRQLSGVQIPAGTKAVFIRAHCSVDGWGEALHEIALAP